MPDTALTEPSDRRAVFVVGSGRSGTSTMSGTLQALGMYVPQPEVSANETNPKGFGEPEWIVNFHTDLLQRARVQTSDARPSAWFEAGKLVTREVFRNQLFDWFEAQFEAGGDQLVIKDPRLSWFIGLWRSAAIRSRAVPSFVTMLRPVTEVVGSKQKYYAGRLGETNRTAGWVNVMLHTERATRGAARAFVRYDDLLRDWTIPVAALGDALDLPSIKDASPGDMRKVEAFIDPQLRRVRLTWDDISVPVRLKELAEETSQALDTMADPGGDNAETQATLDQLREAYVAYYDEAEALTQSSQEASFKEGAASAGAAGGDQLSKLPHRLRAMVPGPMRRALRKGLGS